MTPNDTHNSLHLSDEAQSCQAKSDVMVMTWIRVGRTTSHQEWGTNFQSHAYESKSCIGKGEADRY